MRRSSTHGGAPRTLTQLVAHHSGARFEARERGLLDRLEFSFPAPDPALLDALTYADLTTRSGKCRSCSNQPPSSACIESRQARAHIRCRGARRPQQGPRLRRARRRFQPPPLSERPPPCAQGDRASGREARGRGPERLRSVQSSLDTLAAGLVTIKLARGSVPLVTSFSTASRLAIVASAPPRPSLDSPPSKRAAKASPALTRLCCVDMNSTQLGLLPAPGYARHETPDGLLPTNLTTYRHPIHRWFNFIAGFSPEFVRQCVDSADMRGGGRLIDPFAGLGTALVEANFLGMELVGYEPHPFFADIARAKLNPPRTLADVAQLSTMLLGSQPCSPDELWAPKPLSFLRSLVPEGELERLSGARRRELAGVPDMYMYRLALSRVLESAAGAQTDGIYKAPATRKRSIAFDDAVRTVTRMIGEDVSLAVPMYAQSARIFESSAEDMSALDDASFDIAVTSPPYLNNFDFAEMARMELYFWHYAISWREITDRVRERLIVNTTTAPTHLKAQQDRFRESLPVSFREIADPLVSALTAARAQKNGSKDYERLVYPYFGQMRSVMSELYRVLRPGADLHLVVADAALYGVHVETERLLGRVMEATGFRVLVTRRLRDRGHRWVLAKRTGPGRPLGEFHIHARRP